VTGNRSLFLQTKEVKGIRCDEGGKKVAREAPYENENKNIDIASKAVTKHTIFYLKRKRR